ncbi:MAG TPA: hypothetical protein VGD44_25165 [Phenylobacterium sp.]
MPGRSEGAHQGPEERDGLGLSVAVTRLAPRALDYRNHLLGRIDVDALAEGAQGQERSGVEAARERRARQGPPVVAVPRRTADHKSTERGRRAVGLAGEIAPACRQDPPTVESLAIFQHQQAEAADVAQAGADTHPTQLQTILGFQLPEPVGLHAGRSPDGLREIVGQRAAGGRRDHGAEQEALAGRIVEDGALRRNTRQGAQEVQDGAWPPTRHGLAQSPYVATVGIVALVPGHARSHPQQIADCHVLVGRTAQLRQVEVATIVQAADRALVERGADERRGHRLRRRKARPAGLRAAAQAVALQRDLAVLQDQEPGRPPPRHEVVDADHHIPHGEGLVCERPVVGRQRPHRVASPDHPMRPDLVLVAEGRRLVLGGRLHDVPNRPLRLGGARVHAAAFLVMPPGHARSSR